MSPAGDPDGDVLVTLHLPMPARTVAALCAGIDEVARSLGYTEVVLLTDGTNRVVARRSSTRPAGGAARGDATTATPRTRGQPPAAAP